MVTGWSPEQCHGLLTEYVESRLPRWLRRHLGVSDVVQSVLCKAERCSDQFRGTTELQFRGWLIRIAENKIIDSLRRYQLRSFPPDKRVGMSVSFKSEVDSQTPDELLVLVEQASLLLEAIERLPADVKAVVVARYTRDLTFAEIGARLGMSESTCQRRWIEGIKMLASQLGESRS